MLEARLLTIEYSFLAIYWYAPYKEGRKKERAEAAGQQREAIKS